MNSIRDPDRWEERDVQLPPNMDRIFLNKRNSAIAWNEYRERWVALLENFGNVY